MILSRYRRPIFLFLLFLTVRPLPAHAVNSSGSFPYPEKLVYSVEWRLMNAGSATIQLLRDDAAKGWNFSINIQSAGLVSRLYRVADSYKVTATDHLCLSNATLDAQEGKKHIVSRLVVDNSRRKLSYEERNSAKNQVDKRELDIAPCTYEIAGALAVLRTLNLDGGKSTTVPLSDGKKFAQVRIEAQAKENITVSGKRYATTRYEAFVFDNVVYKRRGRLLIWLSDGPDHVPVQFRLLFGFPIGTITVGLQKQEK